MTHVIPVGTSEAQDFVVRDNGVPVNGVGWTVGIEILGANGLPPATLPTVTWLSTAAGTVRVTGTETLPAGTYRVRFRLTDSGGAEGFAPNLHAPDLWIVVEVP